MEIEVSFAKNSINQSILPKENAYIFAMQEDCLASLNQLYFPLSMDYGIFGMIVLNWTICFFLDLPCSVPFEFEASYNLLEGNLCFFVYFMEHVRFLSSWIGAKLTHPQPGELHPPPPQLVESIAPIGNICSNNSTTWLRINSNST